jgi:hypothetical protein
MRLPRVIRKIITRRDRIKRREAAALLEAQRPRTLSSDDTYIVEYPKSGSTWLSFLIANVNLQINNIPAQATWWNIREYVFDVEFNRDLPANPFVLPHGRFIHTHSLYQRAYTRVLYLIRDPRDTLVSYYDMGTKMKVFKGSMDDFLLSTWGIPSWNGHVESWIRNHSTLDYIQFIRYEDLKTNPVEVLSRIYKLYGLTVDQSVLETAVERSSFQNMRQSEAFYREKSYDLGSTFQFVRKGVSGGFSEGLTSAQIALIEERCAEWMKVFNYPFTTNVPDKKPAS